MKPLKELKFEELSVKQKLGLIHTPRMSDDFPEATIEYICNQIRNHALGAVWIQFSEKNSQKYMKMVREIADYPILIITDAESGIGEYMVGKSNSIACTGDERYAYAFGKVTAFQAHEMGYNVVCHPLLDISTGGGQRYFGSDKHIIAKMCAAVARGVHDAGVLTIGKHYPSGTNVKGIDSHMAESYSDQTAADLLENGLFAYMELMKEDLLDGVMTGHKKFPNIDPNYPTSLSKPVIDIIRNQGFDGLAITDALMMMGIRANYGDEASGPLCIAAGNDLALPYHSKVQLVQQSLYDAYEKGMITDERLDEAVKRILAAQHKAMLLEQTRAKSLTDEEKDLTKRINRDSIYAQADEGLTTSISRDAKHLFALMVRNEQAIGVDGGVAVDTFSSNWLHPTEVVAKINELFPNSEVKIFHQFPAAVQNMHILNASAECEDVIFLTFSETIAYAGGEYITERVVSLMKSMQYSNKISTLVHFGNPCILHSLPHIPRYILGGNSTESVNACLDVLAGEHEAKGVKTYDFTLN
jgi:beta-glucosidase-like glycosyl hydrolase